MPRPRALAVVISVALVALLSATARADPVVTTGTGANPAALQPTVDSFRTQLGTPVNTLGPAPAGRREINWDGVPDANATPNVLPFNFFNANVPRGVLFTATNGGPAVTRVSATNPPRFGNINPNYVNLFQTFSAPRLFDSESRPLDLVFRLPGSLSGATTSGFGAVFTSVTLTNSTSLQFFNENGRNLGTFFAPTGALSFLGVRFDEGERVELVRIQAGNAPLGPAANDTGIADIVAMDDFVFAEPQALAPEGESFETGLDPFVAQRQAGQAGDLPWTASTTDQYAGTNAAFQPGAATVTDMTLTSPPVAIRGGGPSRLTFFHRFATELGFDGGRLEVSTDNGATWSAPAAGQFVEGAPNGTIGAPANPLANQAAWTGNSAGFQRTIVDLAPLAGETIRYRFRYGSDASVASRGWWVDNVSVQTPGAPTTRPQDRPGPTRPRPGERGRPPRPGGERATIVALSLRPDAFRAANRRGTTGGSTLRFTLTQPATVRFTVAREVDGRVVRGRCRAGARRGRRCTTTQRVATFSLRGRRGRNTAEFSGRFEGRRLPPGDYRLRARVGSSRRTIEFTILRASRRSRR